MNPPTRASHSTTDHPALLLKVQAESVARLAKGFAAVLDRVDDVLFDFLQKSHGSEQQHYADAMREVRRGRGEVERDLVNYMEAAFHALHQGDPLEAERALADHAPGALSLVTEDILESQIAARMLAATIQREHGPALAALNQRLGWVAGRIQLDDQTNPVGPGHISVAVHVAFQNLDIAASARLILFKLVERDMSSALGSLYEQANRQLVQSGVLPHLHRQPAKTRGPSPGSRRQDAQGPVYPGDHANEHVAHGATYGYDAGYLDGRDAGVQEVAYEVGSARGRPLDASEQALFATLSDMLRTWRHDHGQAESIAARAAAGARPLTPEEMLAVLSLLQPEIPLGVRLAIDDPSQPITQRLKAELLACAKRLGVDPETVCLSTMDEDAIDLVGMLFDVLLDERELAGTGRTLLGRLVVPYIKVALLDRRMFLRKTHPARKLLNALAEACEGNAGDTAHDRALLDKAEDLVSQLLADFNENISIFQTLEDEFSAFLEQHRKRVELAERRTADAQRGQERLESARNAAIAELDSRLQGRTPGPAMDTLLRRYWVHHLTVTDLRHGRDAEMYRLALAAADQIVGCLDEGAAGSAALASTLPRLRELLVPVISSSGTTGASIDELVALLERELRAIDDGSADAAMVQAEVAADLAAQPVPAGLAEPPSVRAREQDAETVPGLRLVAGRDELDFDPKDAEQVRALAIGSWVEFIGEDGTAQPAKLSWQSPISSRLLFVNRRGGRVCVASAEELAAMMRANRLRIRAVNTAFERAMHQVLGKLKHTA